MLHKILTISNKKLQNIAQPVPSQKYAYYEPGEYRFKIIQNNDEGEH